MKYSLFFAISVLFSIPSFAQENNFNPCGTQDGKVQWLQDYQKNPQAYPKSLDTLFVPLSIHIVGDDLGSGYFNKGDLLKAFCTLQEDFKESAIQFFIEGDWNYINNTDYYDHNWANGSEMMAIHKVSNTINCYIVESPAGNCGYSAYNKGIALAKDCMGYDDHTWAHEIGHYLSLPHPFWGWEGFDHNYNNLAPVMIDDDVVERVDGSNCNFAGDGFCDTPPDYLNSRWNCNSDGESGILQSDPVGETFRSDGTLIMSYSNDECANRFSDDQIDAMRANLMTEHSNFLYNQDPQGPIEVDPWVIISPAQDELLDIYSEVHFEWEPLSEATHYYLEVSPFPTMVPTQFIFDIEGHSHTSYDLFKNKTYYWRLRPYNHRFTCKVYTEIHSFQTGDVNAVQSIEAIADLRVYPNPTNGQSVVFVNLVSNRNLDLDVSISSIAGQALQNFQWNAHSGNNEWQIETHNLEAGIYLLQLQSANGVMTRKLVINK